MYGQLLKIGDIYIYNYLALPSLTLAELMDKYSARKKDRDQKLLPVTQSGISLTNSVVSAQFGLVVDITCCSPSPACDMSWNVSEH